MQNMLATIAAGVIAAGILLVLAVLNWRIQHHAIDTVQYSAAKASGLDAARLVEEDLANLGAGLTTTTLELNGAFSAYDATAGTYEFITWASRDARADDVAADDGDMVRYEVRRTTGVDAYVRQGGSWASVPTYTLTRTQGAQSGAYDGLTQLSIQLYDRAGAVTTNTRLACEVEVTIQAVAPLGGGDARMVDERGNAPYVDQTRWNHRFKPVNLSRAAACRS